MTDSTNVPTPDYHGVYYRRGMDRRKENAFVVLCSECAAGRDDEIERRFNSMKACSQCGKVVNQNAS